MACHVTFTRFTQQRTRGKRFFHPFRAAFPNMKTTKKMTGETPEVRSVQRRKEERKERKGEKKREQREKKDISKIL